jgi:hypothetical protein
MRSFILILILALAGCSSNQISNSGAAAATNGNSGSTNNSASSEPKTIETLLALPDDFKPAYKIADTRDVGVGNVKRYAVSITLPSGLKKEEVERNFKHAILQTYKDKKPKAITIWGYQVGDDLKQPFTVGDAVFAPNGKWESAGEGAGDLQNYQTIIKVKDSYLNAKNDISVGDEVTLTAFKSDVIKDQDTTSVRIWNDYGNRYDSNILMKVPNGTKAKILEKKQTGAGDYISTVYKVEVKQKTGWVDFFDIKEYQDGDSKK